MILNKQNLDGFKRLVEEFKRTDPDALLLFQISHSGSHGGSFSKSAHVYAHDGEGDRFSTDELAKARDEFIEGVLLSQQAGADGVEVMPLFSDGREDVVLERWAPGAKVSFPSPEGAELLVLNGSFEEAGESFGVQGWLRLPKGGTTQISAGPDGARVWIKRGHLKEAPTAPSA